MKEQGSPGSQRGKGRRHSLNVGMTHRVGPPLPLQHKSSTGDASIGLLAGVMSPLMAEPTNRNAMLFGRYWGLNGHREARELEGSVAIDPNRTSRSIRRSNRQL
jgi:hypothetical protein